MIDFLKLDTVLEEIISLWGVPGLGVGIVQEGGIQAAYARYGEIKDSPEYFFDEYELVTLVYQLMSVKKFDLAIAVLKLNLQVFPHSSESYHLLGKLYLQKGETQQAEAMFQQEQRWKSNP